MNKELQSIGLVGLGALMVGGAALGSVLGWIVAGQWFLQSLLLWGFVHQQTRRREDLNRASLTSPPYSDLGLANRLTLLRGWLISATAGFLFLSTAATWIAWMPAALYSVAAILDRIDGFVARRSDRISLLGSELDTVFDALGLLVAPLLAVLYGKVHWSYLLVSVAYYCFVAGLRWREAHGLPIYPLAPSKLRRTLAGFQMGYVAVVLWPPFDAHITLAAGFGFMIPLLIGFIVDWMTVSGRINEQSSTMAFFNRLASISNNTLQPGLRVVAVLSISWLTTSFDSPIAVPLLIAAALMLVGLGGRMAATAALMLMAWQIPGGEVSTTASLALISTIAILLLGCGRFSLWQWDDLWVNRQDGA